MGRNKLLGTFWTDFFCAGIYSVIEKAFVLFKKKELNSWNAEHTSIFSVNTYQLCIILIRPQNNAFMR